MIVASGTNTQLRTKDQAATDSDPGPSVSEICLAFSIHAESHYVKNGKPTSEIHCYKSCLRILRQLYGMTAANDFGPLALKAVRAQMVELGWARTTINVMVGRIRRVFKYAIENEMIDERVLRRLQSVAPLLAGRTKAIDYPRRYAIEQVQIDRVRNRVSPLVKDLIDLQLLSGARSGELLSLTTRMIDFTGETWKAVLTDHKCAHHGQRRILHFGPQAQAIISKYLSTNTGRALFKITRTAYCRSITRACEQEQIERWTPHWLRHTFCTRIREKFGIEAAQALAGHATTEMTDHYTKNMLALAQRTAASIG